MPPSRGPNWGVGEVKHIAEAWRENKKNAVPGIVQTSDVFRRKLFSGFLRKNASL